MSDSKKEKETRTSPAVNSYFSGLREKTLMVHRVAVSRLGSLQAGVKAICGRYRVIVRRDAADILRKFIIRHMPGDNEQTPIE